MGNRFKVFGLAVSVILFLAFNSFAENLLRNPSFETEGGWVKYNFAEAKIRTFSDDTARTGEYSAKISEVKPGKGGIGWNQRVPVNPDTDYKFSVWVKFRPVQNKF